MGHSTLRRAGWGALAGLAATVAMTGVMKLSQKSHLLGETPPRKLVRRTLGRIGLGPRRSGTLTAATTAAHLGFGATMGALFSLMPREARRSPLGGTLFGLGVWAVSYAGVIPALGLMAPPSRDRVGRPTTMALAHVVYGASLRALLNRLDRSSDAAENPG